MPRKSPFRIELSPEEFAELSRRAVKYSLPYFDWRELGTIVRNTCRTPGAGPQAPTFDIVTTPNATQRHALDLVKQIRP